MSELRGLKFWLETRGFHAGTGEGGSRATFVHAEQRAIVEVKAFAGGVRTLWEGAFQAARALARNLTAERATLVIALERVRPERVAMEWTDILQLLRPGIAGRLRLLAVVEGELMGAPAEVNTTELAQHLRELIQRRPGTRGTTWARVKPLGPSLGPTSALGSAWRQLEIEKVLVDRWLMKEGPIPLGELASRVGCTYPTTAQAIKRLESAKLIARGKGRSVELVQYPRANWVELLRAQRLVYRPTAFVHPMEIPQAAESLLARLHTEAWERVAEGGVVAARHWVANVEIAGTPRLDVVMHAPEAAEMPEAWERKVLEWVKRVDPALRPRTEDAQPAVLVVHRTYRRDALFVRSEGGGPSFAPPVETIMHLLELGLVTQAGAVLKRLRSEVAG